MQPFWSIRTVLTATLIPGRLGALIIRAERGRRVDWARVVIIGVLCQFLRLQ